MGKRAMHAIMSLPEAPSPHPPDRIQPVQDEVRRARNPEVAALQDRAVDPDLRGGPVEDEEPATRPDRHARAVMPASWPAFEVLPGGFGAMDEMFEALTLVGAARTTKFPVVLAGDEYSAGLPGWLRERMLAEGKIGAQDLTLPQIADTADGVVKTIKDATPPDLKRVRQLSPQAKAASGLRAVVLRAGFTWS